MKNLFESLSDKWSTSVNEAKKTKAFKDVKVGDIGFDQNGEKVKIYAVGKASDKELAKFDQVDFAKEEPQANAVVVASVKDPKNKSLFSYGEDGILVNEGAVNESVDDITDIKYTDKVELGTQAAPKDAEVVIDFEKVDANKDAEFKGKITATATTKTELNPDNIKMDEGFKAADLKDNNDYLVTYKGAEAYMQYVGKKDGKHQFDNSGKITALTDAEVAKHVTNENINEAEQSYQEFFKKKLKKFGVTSIGALGDKKSDFFTEIEKEWDENEGLNESKQIAESVESNQLINDIQALSAKFDVYHHNTKSFAQHKAFDDIHSEFDALEDGAIERIIGYTGARYNRTSIDITYNDKTGIELVGDCKRLGQAIIDFANANSFADLEQYGQSIHGLGAKLNYLLTLTEAAPGENYEKGVELGTKAAPKDEKEFKSLAESIADRFKA